MFTKVGQLRLPLFINFFTETDFVNDDRAQSAVRPPNSILGSIGLIRSLDLDANAVIHRLTRILASNVVTPTSLAIRLSMIEMQDQAQRNLLETKVEFTKKDDKALLMSVQAGGSLVGGTPVSESIVCTLQ